MSSYLSPEDRIRPNESEPFRKAAAELEARTKLSAMESRGTLSLALKISGFLNRDVDRDALKLTIRSVLPRRASCTRDRSRRLDLRRALRRTRLIDAGPAHLRRHAPRLRAGSASKEPPPRRRSRRR